MTLGTWRRGVVLTGFSEGGGAKGLMGEVVPINPHNSPAGGSQAWYQTRAQLACVLAFSRQGQEH